MTTQLNQAAEKSIASTSALQILYLPEMAFIPGGIFQMGSEAETNSRSNESPQHQVSVDSFLMGKYPVTQAQWEAVASRHDLKVARDLEPNPSHFKGSDRPVEQVTWEDAMEFCARLSKLTGHKYRLPSEAEWEYACRAGTTTPFYFGETITEELVHHDAEYDADWEKTIPVGCRPPNAFGLYDMHGNVMEWCLDNWHQNYKGAPNDGSAWVSPNNLYHSVRGGSWGSRPKLCRSAARDYAGFDSSDFDLGFRVCVSIH